MKRLTQEEWSTVLSNVGDGEGIEVTWLDGSDEWCLNVDCELLEDGFKSEKEAQDRLDYVGATQSSYSEPTTEELLDLANTHGVRYEAPKKNKQYGSILRMRLITALRNAGHLD